MAIDITTNNHPREILMWIPEEFHSDFDYINWDAVKEGTDSVSFVKYKGSYVDLHDLEGILPGNPSWAYMSMSFSFGWCFKYVEVEHDYYVVCGYYKAGD